MTLNITDTLPALRRHAKELITSTAGIRKFVAEGADLSGYLLDVPAATAIAIASRALETTLLRLEQTLAAHEAERHQLEVAFAALTCDDPDAPHVVAPPQPSARSRQEPRNPQEIGMTNSERAARVAASRGVFSP
jgi:hypothetical protein